MLPANRDTLLERLDDGALVLDVGGGAAAFPRADWVIDLLGYDERDRFGAIADPAAERFTEDTWVKRDVCDREPWPFADDQFDMVVCSHTLEDIRDPIFVCSELNRVSKAGYIEVPSRLEEQSVGVHGPWVGWSHHRWLIDVEGDEISFVFKSHVLCGRPEVQFPAGFWQTLTPAERVTCLWWEGGFRYRERIFLDYAEFDAYLAGPVEARPGLTGRSRRSVLRSRFGR